METTIKNNNFTLLDKLFKKQDWNKSKNNLNQISWVKKGYENDEFEIQINEKNIFASIPLKNSTYKYKTIFNNHFLASEYLKKRFIEFEN